MNFKPVWQARKKTIWFVLMLLGAAHLMSLVVRHDVKDADFINYAKKFPQICHFPMGEGTLIEKQWVLTAGHIGNDLKRDLESGRQVEMLCNGKAYKIEGVVVHPAFKPIEEGLDNDIALVKLSLPVQNVVPAKVYALKDEKGKLISLVGMGDVGTGLTGPQKWDKITRASTNRIDGTEKNWIYFRFDSPTDKSATPLEGISGPGDSGGPAFYNDGKAVYVLGVSSFQKGQDKYGRGHYGVTEYYSRVSTYSSWISQTIKSGQTGAGISH